MRRLILLLAVLLLTACGGEGAAPRQASSPRQAVKQAAENMKAAGTVRYTAASSYRIKALAQKGIPFNVKGLMRLDGKDAWLWGDGSKLYPIIFASSAPRGERDIARNFLENDTGWQIEVRHVGNKEWQRIPALAELIGAKPWFRITDPRDDATSIEAGELWSTPLGILVALRALRHVKQSGTDTIDGRNTTRYRGRVELRRLRSPLKKYRAELRKTVEGVIRQTGKTTLPMEVWIDDDGLPRRVLLTDIEPKDAATGFLARIRATIDLVEYGVDFHVLRPPASKVMTDMELDRLTGS